MNKVCVFLVIILLSACGGGSSDFESVNTAPWISGSISTIRVGETLNWTPEAIDAAPITEPCDVSDVSILEFINGRSAALYQELNENGF